MPRRPSLKPASSLDVHLDAELRLQLDLLLWSESEQRIPYGAYQRFFNTLIRQALQDKGLDLAPYIGTPPGTSIVRGPLATIQALKARLEQR